MRYLSHAAHFKLGLAVGFVLLAGCATTRPTLPAAARAYHGPRLTYHGVTYFPLRSLCDTWQWHWEWNRLTQVVILQQGGAEVRFLADSRAVLIDGVPHRLAHPVTWVEGTLAAPEETLRFLAPVEPQGPRLARPSGRYRVRRIVIDAGHGGHDPGAIGAGGVREKNVVLDIARRLQQQLAGRGFEVLLTRDSDRFLPLERRARLANQLAADFFVSIHANAMRDRTVTGIEVFYGGKAREEADRAWQQAAERTIRLGNRTINHADRTLRAIVWDLLNVEHRRESFELAQHLARQLATRLGTPNRGAKPARFQVLRQTNMPAVLVEVGFLSSRREGQRLEMEAYRQRIAQVVAEALVSYLRFYERRDGFTL